MQLGRSGNSSDACRGNLGFFPRVQARCEICADVHPQVMCVPDGLLSSVLAFVALVALCGPLNLAIYEAAEALARRFFWRRDDC
jgi:hypothetical protein